MSLLPRDVKFFDLLVLQAKIAAEASTTLAQSFGNGGGMTDAKGTAERIRTLERKGDEMVREIYQRLHKSFITPIDPEDLHELASRIDEILDHLDALAYRFDAFGLKHAPDGMAELTRMVDGCVQAVFQAIEELEKEGVKKPEYLTTLCEKINQQEFETESRVREAVRRLFETERDPLELIKQKEIYELLEQTADCCEDVADVLEAVAVKNT